jgi:hypothetical protein
VTDAAEAAREPGKQLALLREALGLWRGTPLADVRGQWADGSRVAWRQQRLDAAVAWAQAELRLGDGTAVIGAIRDLLAEYPLAEPLAATLMRALGAAGRIPEALEYYAALRERLAEELGTEPGPELRGLHLALLRGDVDATRPPQSSWDTVAEGATVPGPTVPSRPVYPRPAQLPRPVRGFTGCRAALDALDELLDSDDASTVVISAISGTAGIGKTALAVHWAHGVANRFPDGQLYVNLRGFDASGQVMDPSTVVRQFLVALGVAAERIPVDVEEQTALYRSLLAGKRILVLLDNARDAEQVRPLLPGSPAALTVDQPQSTHLVGRRRGRLPADPRTHVGRGGTRVARAAARRRTRRRRIRRSGGDHRPLRAAAIGVEHRRGAGPAVRPAPDATGRGAGRRAPTAGRAGRR